MEYFADHHPATAEGQHESLYIPLDVEDEAHPEREYGLEVFFINDVLEAFGDQEEDEDAIIAQFMLILPFRIPVDYYLDTLRYCGVANRMLPIGAFGLSEQDGAVYLRYCLATESRAIPQVVLLEVVSAMEYSCKEYGSQFEKISKGELTVDEYLREMEASGHALPPVVDPDLFAAG